MGQRGDYVDLNAPVFVVVGNGGDDLYEFGDMTDWFVKFREIVI